MIPLEIHDSQIDSNIKKETSQDPNPIDRSRSQVLQQDSKYTKKEKYCICNKVYNPKLFYIQCDCCDEWFHGTCVNITEELGEEISKWFCSDCIKLKGCIIIWKAECRQDHCKNRSRSSSIYCSVDCGRIQGEKRFQNIVHQIPRMPNSREYRIIRKRKLLLDLDSLNASINKRKVRIRNLEKRQIFIDDCMERIYKYHKDNGQTNPNTKTCGFDERILSFGFSDVIAEEFPVIHDQAFQNSKDEMNLDPSVNEELLSTMCAFQGRCPIHDSWDIIKSKEVELELEQEIELYQQEQNQRLQVILKISNHQQAKEIIERLQQ